jgi:CheY-like chemotaxis protein
VGPTVLIVDDHAAFRASARSLLEAEGLRANLYTIHPDGTGLKQLTFAEGGESQYFASS